MKKIPSDHTPSFYRKTFLASVPDQFLQECLVSLYLSLNRAKEICLAIGSGALRGTRQGLIPFVRRALLAHAIRETTERYSNLAATEQSTPKGSHHYLLVENEHIAMTASSLPRPNAFPRRARFRDTWARNNQLSLPFLGTEEAQEINSETARLYAILVYGPGGRKVPEFASIRFPDPENQKFIAAADIDLFDRYPHVVKLFSEEQDYEEIGDFELKTHIQRQREHLQGIQPGDVLHAEPDEIPDDLPLKVKPSARQANDDEDT